MAGRNYLTTADYSSMFDDNNDSEYFSMMPPRNSEPPKVFIANSNCQQSFLR